MIWKIIKRINPVLLCGLMIVQISCKKLIEVDAPITNLNEGNVYENDATAMSVLTGLYQSIGLVKLEDMNTKGISHVTLYAGLSSDELMPGLADAELLTYYSNSLKSTGSISSLWEDSYNKIYTCNSVIEGINKSNNLSLGVKKELMGEAKFMRAFCYFYLVNEFGNIPLTTVTDYKVNSTLPRTSKDEVYQLIVGDLKDAQLLLADKYVDGGGINPTVERVRPNKWAATALLSRVYLYTNQYSNAEVQSSQVIEMSSLYKLVNLDDVFLKNSNEAIWQIQSVIDNFNTPEGLFFTPQFSEGLLSLPFALPSMELINSFENNDERRTHWINTFNATGSTYLYPYKYKNVISGAAITEYSMVLRLAEQYLIRAEARIQLGRIAEGIADLNKLRERASSKDVGANRLEPLALGLNKAQALTAVFHERRVELFTEWGHRWFDLKRSSQIDAVLGVIKGKDWQSTDQLYPIPQRDIDMNPNLTGHQNPGYQ